MRKPNGLDHEIYDRQVRICKAFANPTRLHILDMVAQGAQTTATLQKELGVSTPNLSQHLTILKAAGVVTTWRDGKQLYCSLTIPEVKQACQLIRDVLRVQLRNGRKLAI